MNGRPSVATSIRQIRSAGLSELYGFHQVPGVMGSRSLHRMAERKKCCLLVEDAPDDALMVQKHLTGHPDYDFAWVENAEDAVRFLERQPPFADAPTAGVILLDLRLPGMDGFEFLE